VKIRGEGLVHNKGHIPSDEAVTKLIYLALRNITAKRKDPPKEWHAAKTQFAIQLGDRFVLTVRMMRNGSAQIFCRTMVWANMSFRRCNPIPPQIGVADGTLIGRLRRAPRVA